jgi:putative FmdB family regulatory protein
MPIYEYRCNDCASTYELMRPMAEREIATVCPKCESRASMPLISRVNAGIGSPTGGAAAYSDGGGSGGCCGGNCGCSN